MKTIIIKQWSTPLAVSKGTILEAALKAGVPYPHGCRTGKCGQCKTLVTSGEVKHGDYFKEALSDAEREQGHVLACQARPATDLEISWQVEVDPGTAVPVGKIKSHVMAYEPLSVDVTRILLQTRTPLGFAAGQYCRLHFGRLPARSFSMANRPGDALLEFHVSRVPGGLISGYVADRLAVGDKVIVEGPFGNSHLRQNETGPLIAVAGNTGLAPMLSIIRQALAVDPAQEIHLYFGVRTEADIYAHDDLIALGAGAKNLTVHTVLSGVSTAYLKDVRIGLLHEALKQDFSDLSHARLYTAGPPPMIEAVLATALARGMAEARIHTDPFVSSGDGSGDGPIRRLVRSFSDAFSRKPLAGATPG